ncbi:LutC/YkgG family protein [Propionibacteriaceae bacterium Y1685]|uniref:LutC/YkgG family protein n=1 Tax=Microlunatus sp. Y1700 TaxID=3418487 RepID=UPI003B797975
MDARERILSSVRSAIEGAVDPAVPRDYRRSLDDTDLIDLFAERVGDYRAEVHVIDDDELPRRIGQVLGEHSVRSLIIPDDLSAKWLVTTSCKVIPDDGQADAAELDGIHAVLTGCAAAVALTGTIVLDGGTLQGRRLISLIPDLHVCVVPAASIVGTVPEVLSKIDGTRPLTWISGPSATSDIELDRVEGVHGPRTLVVLITR